MAAKHHVNLKVVEEFLRRKSIRRKLQRIKAKKQILEELVKNFRSRAENYFIKNQERSFLMNSRKLRLFMTFTKESVKMQGQRPWPVIVVASQHIKS